MSTPDTTVGAKPLLTTTRAVQDPATRGNFGLSRGSVEVACSRGGCRWISRLNVSRLSQTVEGLELVFGERLGGRGVDCGGGGVDRLPHHVQGCKGIERCCGGSVFVAEEAHDDR